MFVCKATAPLEFPRTYEDFLSSSALIAKTSGTGRYAALVFASGLSVPFLLPSLFERQHNKRQIMYRDRILNSVLHAIVALQKFV
jgi:hypothetical protein